MHLISLFSISGAMTSAQQLIQSNRDLLLNWTRDHPAPLLRWLHDDGVLSPALYMSLLEKSSFNAVAQALETVCATETSSAKFLQVLKGVQDYYCKDLQAWVERHCKNDTVREPVPPPVQVGGEVDEYKLCMKSKEVCVWEIISLL